MAMIQGPGNFGNNQPVGNTKRTREQAPQQEQGTQWSTDDVLIKTSDEAPVRSEEKTEFTRTTEATARQAETPVAAPKRPTLQEFEGAFLVGPGVNAHGVSSVGASSNSSVVSDRAFTNGLNHNKIITIDGRVLAEVNPFR